MTDHISISEKNSKIRNNIEEQNFNKIKNTSNSNNSFFSSEFGVFPSSPSQLEGSKKKGGFRTLKPPSLNIPRQSVPKLVIKTEQQEQQQDETDSIFNNLEFTSTPTNDVNDVDDFFIKTPLGKEESLFSESSPSIGKLFSDLGNDQNQQQDSWFPATEFGDLFTPKTSSTTTFSSAKFNRSQFHDSFSPSCYLNYEMQAFPTKTTTAIASSSALKQQPIKSTSSLINLNNNNNAKKEKKKKEESKKKKKVVKVKKAEQAVLSDSTRKWKLLSKDDSLKDIKCEDLVIQSKTRREAWADFFPDRMYSSLKYEIKLSAKGKSLMSKPLIIARMVVIDAQTKIEEKKDGSSCLTLKPEGALTLADDKNHLTCSLKIQFVNGLSYHQEKREFICEVRYFDRGDLKNPIIVKRSKPFRIYARKPNASSRSKTKKGSSQKKRKLNQTTISPTPSISSTNTRKRSKKTEIQKVSNMDEFLSRLDELVKVNLKLNDTEKQLAMNIVLNRLLQQNSNSNGNSQLGTTFQSNMNMMNYDNVNNLYSNRGTGIENLFPSEDDESTPTFINSNLFTDAKHLL